MKLPSKFVEFLSTFIVRRSRRGRDRMMVEITNSYAISVYNH